MRTSFVSAGLSAVALHKRKVHASFSSFDETGVALPSCPPATATGSVGHVEGEKAAFVPDGKVISGPEAWDLGLENTPLGPEA
jgi:hypothetical protein